MDPPLWAFFERATAAVCSACDRGADPSDHGSGRTRQGGRGLFFAWANDFNLAQLRCRFLRSPRRSASFDAMSPLRQYAEPVFIPAWMDVSFACFRPQPSPTPSGHGRTCCIAPNTLRSGSFLSRPTPNVPPSERSWSLEFPLTGCVSFALRIRPRFARPRCALNIPPPFPRPERPPRSRGPAVGAQRCGSQRPSQSSTASRATPPACLDGTAPTLRTSRRGIVPGS